VIVVGGDLVFAAASPPNLEGLVRRTLAGAEIKLLDQTWEWFELAADDDLVLPSFLNRLPPTKRAVVALVNGRSNRTPDAPDYQLRSLSNHTREDIFAELIALLPTR